MQTQVQEEYKKIDLTRARREKGKRKAQEDSEFDSSSKTKSILDKNQS